MKHLLAATLFASLALAGGEWSRTEFTRPAEPGLRVVPCPREAAFTGEWLTVSRDLAVSDAADTPVTRNAAELFRRQLERDTLPGATGAIVRLEFTVLPGEFPGGEAYRLEIGGDSVRIAAGGERGVLYGVQSLRQLLAPAADGSAALPAGRIDDRPDLAWRGIFTTGIDGPATHNLLLDAFALLKFNTVIIRVDQMLQYENTPALGHPTAARPKSEYRDFVRRGRLLGMEMIPCSSLYSHFGWALWSDYGYLAEVPGGAIPHFATPDVDNPDTWKLIRSIMGEVVEAFDHPRYYHVGQDELSIAPQSPNPKRTLLEKFRIALGHLQANCAELGVTMMMWADQLNADGAGGPPDRTAEVLAELPRDTILCDWSYFGMSEQEFPGLANFAKTGLPILGAVWYEPLSIEAFTTQLERTPNVLGSLATMWGGMSGYLDSADTQMAAVWTAENSWSVGRPEYRDYRNFPTNTFYLACHALSPLARSYWTMPLPQTPESDPNEVFPALDRLPQRLEFADFALAPDRNIVVLDSSEAAGKPEATVDLGGQCADALSVAHIAGLPPRRALAFTNLDNKRQNEPCQIAIYRITYADGETTGIPIRYGREITDWNEPAGASLAPVIWDGHAADGTMARIVAWRWRNPRPEVPLASLRLEAADSPMPIAIFGVNLERY